MLRNLGLLDKIIVNYWKLLVIIVRENKPLAAKRRDIIV